MANVDFTQDVTGQGDFAQNAAGAATENTNGTNGGASASAKAADSANEDRKIFIGGLSWETKEQQLKEYFAKFGEVDAVNLKINPMTGRSRCFAFVVFKEPAALTKVFDAGEHAINSKKVDVKRAKAKPGKLFLGGLKPSLTDEEIKAHFEKFGTIVEFEMPFDKVKNQRKGFGFITFEREDTMKDLIKQGSVQIGEHNIDLRKATPRADPFKPGGPGMSFGGNGGAGGYNDYYGGGYGMDYYGGYGGGSSGGGGDYYSGGWGGPSGYGGGGYGGGGYGAGGGKMRGRGGGRGGYRAGPY